MSQSVIRFSVVGGTPNFLTYDTSTDNATCASLFATLKSTGFLNGIEVKEGRLFSSDTLQSFNAGLGVALIDSYSRSANADLAKSVGSVLPGTTPNPTDGTVDGIAQLVMQKTVTLTPANIKAFFSSPYVLVPAPGAGFVLIPLQMIFIARNTGLVAYTRGAGSGAEGPQLCFGGNFAASPFNAVFHTMLTTAAANQMDVFTSPNEWGANVLSAFENQPLTLAGTGTEDYAVGTGTVEVSISYLKVAI